MTTWMVTWLPSSGVSSALAASPLGYKQIELGMSVSESARPHLVPLLRCELHLSGVAYELTFKAHSKLQDASVEMPPGPHLLLLLGCELHLSGVALAVVAAVVVAAGDGGRRAGPRRWPRLCRANMACQPTGQQAGCAQGGHCTDVLRLPCAVAAEKAH